MKRARNGRLLGGIVDGAARIPWWAGLAAAAAGFAVLHRLARAPVVDDVSPGQMGDLALNAMLHGVADAGQYALPIAFVGAAALSLLRRHRRTRRPGEASRRACGECAGDVSWDEFGRLVGEAFRHRGWSVRAATPGDAPDGADLFLSRDDEHALVDCRHFRSPRIGPDLVRDLHARMRAEGATRGFIVTCGGLAPSARSVAASARIDTIDVMAIYRAVRGEAPFPDSASPPAAS